MLSRDTILTAFVQLSNELAKRGVLGELNIIEGITMLLAFNARTSTKDVDAIFEPASDVREAAAAVANALELPADWLNDSVKGLLSPAADFTPLPSINLPNLRVQAPTPEYMLAMKVLAARAGAESEQGDAGDIAFLIRLLGITEADSVLNIVSRYSDPTR